MTDEHAIDLFLDFLRVERRAPFDALLAARDDLGLLRWWVDGLRPLVALTPDDLGAFVLEALPMRDDESRALGTWATLEDFYRFLLVDRRIDVDPFALFDIRVRAQVRIDRRLAGRRSS